MNKGTYAPTGAQIFTPEAVDLFFTPQVTNDEASMFGPQVKDWLHLNMDPFHRSKSNGGGDASEVPHRRRGWGLGGGLNLEDLEGGRRAGTMFASGFGCVFVCCRANDAEKDAVTPIAGLTALLACVLASWSTLRLLLLLASMTSGKLGKQKSMHLCRRKSSAVAMHQSLPSFHEDSCIMRHRIVCLSKLELSVTDFAKTHSLHT